MKALPPASMICRMNAAILRLLPKPVLDPKIERLREHIGIFSGPWSTLSRAAGPRGPAIQASLDEATDDWERMVAFYDFPGLSPGLVAGLANLSAKVRR